MGCPEGWTSGVRAGVITRESSRFSSLSMSLVVTCCTHRDALNVVTARVREPVSQLASQHHEDPAALRSLAINVLLACSDLYILKRILFPHPMHIICPTWSLNLSAENMLHV